MKITITRKSLIKECLLTCCLSIGALTASAGETPQKPGLKFGVFPNLSTRVLLETYQPVADTVSDSSKQPVELQSAADFETFYQRTQSGEYDLLLTAPHLAWLAWKEGGYRPLLAYDQPVRGLLVVRRGSGIKTLADLKAKTVARADPLAIVVMRMEKQLVKAGLRAGRDYQSVEAGSHNNAALLVHQGKVDAGILGALPFRKLAPDVQSGLQIIAETEALPSQVYLVGRRVSPDQETLLLRGIQQFMLSEAGRVFLEKGGFGGIHRLTRIELNRVAVDAQQVKQILSVQAQNQPQNLPGTRQ
jgi:phosphonate transport system substrate-binding protein